MKITSVAELKDNLSKYLSLVESGEEVEVRKRNVPIARIVPLRSSSARGRPLGSGTATVRGRLTEPLIPLEVWQSLGKKR